MRNSKILYWIVQFLSWGILCGIIGVAAVVQSEFNYRTGIKLTELYLLLILFSHIIRWVFIRRDWLNFKLGPLIPRVLGLTLLLSALLMALTTLTNVLFFEEQWLTFSELLVNTLLHSLFLFMWSAVYLTYHLLQKSRLQEINNLKLQANQTQNELKTLRDQLNPHFLFNSLNSIRALIEIEPATASSAITTLSSLLRNSLQLGKKTVISLQEELKLVEEYLQLESIRYEERLSYNLQNDISQSVNIPPFLVQSMVENAIKHGIAKNVKGGKVEVHLYFKKEKLFLSVTNDGVYQNSNNLGIGIENTKRRLEIIYGKDAGFDIENRNNKVHSYIWINKNQLKEQKNESNTH